jgi:hypothetical protein
MNSSNQIIRSGSPSSDCQLRLPDPALRALVRHTALRLVSGLLLSLLAAPWAATPIEEKTCTPESDLDGSWAFALDPALLDVLLIGDSISIGYTRSVRHMLKEKSAVEHHRRGMIRD